MTVLIDIMKKKWLQSGSCSYFLTWAQDYTSNCFGSVSDNNVRKWVTTVVSLQIRYTYLPSWFCQAESHLLRVITAESIHPGNRNSYVCIHIHIHTQRQAHPQYKHTRTHKIIKVIESWQISAASAESLTWGCWTDKPSMGILLASSSS